MRSMFLLIVSLPFCLFTCQETCVAQSKDPIGKIKKVSSYYYDVDKPTADWALKLICTYNKQRNLTGTYIWTTNKRDSSDASLTYMYNHDGKEIMTVDNGRNTTSTDYSYNQIHNLVKTTKSKNNLIVNTFNKNGSVDSVFNYQNGKLTLKLIYTYDQKKRVIKSEESNTNQSYISRRITKYNDKHNTIESFVIKPDGTTESHETFIYDNRGNVLTQVDSNNVYVGGFPMQKVKDKIYSRTFRYDSFDKKGNWIQQSYLINGRYVKCIDREIEYY